MDPSDPQASANIASTTRSRRRRATMGFGRWPPPREKLAERAGVPAGFLDRLIELGLLTLRDEHLSSNTCTAARKKMADDPLSGLATA